MSVDAPTKHTPAAIGFFTAAAGAALGSLGAFTLTTISPLTGAIFGATFSVVELIAQPLFENCMGHKSDNGPNFLAWAASIIVSALATKVIMGLAYGIVLSGEATALLAAATLAAPYLVALAVLAAAVVLTRCCFCIPDHKPKRHFHQHF